MECFHHRYASVFILDLLPLELDGARVQDEAYTTLLDEALVYYYGALGYDVVRVPVLPPEERLEFVLERLSEQGPLPPLEAGAAPPWSDSSIPSFERGSKRIGRSAPVD
jgi:hypothetical protein